MKKMKLCNAKAGHVGWSLKASATIKACHQQAAAAACWRASGAYCGVSAFVPGACARRYACKTWAWRGDDEQALFTGGGADLRAWNRRREGRRWANYGMA